MAFVLYSWGPAFGLPSIDAECIAAISYFNQVLPRDSWALVVASDSSQSPNGDLPMLRHESNYIAGFSAIVEYLESNGYSLDDDLSSQERATSTAIKAHLISNALPLVDATLYTSSANYTAATRPAWTKILPAHANFIVPPRRHEAAKTRTLPLGLSSDSVDDLPPSEFSPQQEQEARMFSTSPSLLFRKRQTLQDALKAQQTRTAFRLESLTDTLMEPMAKILDGERFLLSDEDAGPSSIDCLAYGYFALLLFPDLPNAWVAETIRKKFKSIAAYVEAMRAMLLPNSPVDVAAVMQSPFLPEKDAQSSSIPRLSTTSLPWRTTAPDSLTTIFKSLSTSLLSNIITPIQQHFLFDSSVLVNSPTTALRSWTSPLTLILALSTPVFAVFSFFLYTQTHLDAERDKRFGQPQPRLNTLGEAGNVLSMLGGASPRRRIEPTQSARSNRTSSSSASAVGGQVSNEPDLEHDGEAKQRREQDQAPFSEKPGVSVELNIDPKKDE